MECTEWQRSMLNKLHFFFSCIFELNPIANFPFNLCVNDNWLSFGWDVVLSHWSSIHRCSMLQIQERETRYCFRNTHLFHIFFNLPFLFLSPSCQPSVSGCIILDQGKDVIITRNPLSISIYVFLCVSWFIHASVHIYVVYAYFSVPVSVDMHISYMPAMLFCSHWKLTLKCLLLLFAQVASWMSTETEPPVIKWAPGSLMFVTGSSELSFWIPDLSKLGAYAGRK